MNIFHQVSARALIPSHIVLDTELICLHCAVLAKLSYAISRTVVISLPSSAPNKVYSFLLAVMFTVPCELLVE